MLFGRGFKISHHVGYQVKEGKAVLLHVKQVQRGGTGIALTIFDTSARQCGWSATRPGCFIPGKETRSPLYRGLGDGLNGSRKSRLQRFSKSGPGNKVIFIPVRCLHFLHWLCACKFHSTRMSIQTL